MKQIIVDHGGRSGGWGKERGGAGGLLPIFPGSNFRDTSCLFALTRCKNATQYRADVFSLQDNNLD